MSFRPSSVRLIIALLAGLFLVSACSVRRFIPTDEYLLKSASVTVTAPDSVRNIGGVEDELEALLRPEPNSTFLGMRVGLNAHYKSQKEKPGFLNKYLNRKFGQEPVYLSDVDSSRTMDLISNRLENSGFFNTKVSSTTTTKKKVASVNYKVALGQPYTLEKYELDSAAGTIYEGIAQSLEESPITKGTRFSLDLLKLERERIDTYLKERGYYNFNADFLIFEADTNQYDNRRFNLFLRLKKEVPQKSLLPYKLNKIYVNPDYSLNNKATQEDAYSINGIHFIQDPEFFKPTRMTPYILFKEGQPYNPKISRLTSSRLASIGAYKFVNIRYEPDFDEVSDQDTLGLNANIFLSPLKKRSIRTEVKAVSKSNGFAGPAMAAVYSNRNLFRGGETLNLSANFGYEVQFGTGSTKGLSSTQVGFETGLVIPRLLLPFNVNDTLLYAVPKTNIKFGYDLFNRSDLYKINALNTRFGYSWQKNQSIYHELNPISINYVNTSNISPEFQSILDRNPFLKSSFQEQLITGLTYSFFYNELTEGKKRNPIQLSTNFEFAGNIFGWASKDKDGDGQKKLFGIAYAQFFKADFNFVYHYHLSSKQTLVGRAFGGFGLPYANSESLPFSRQYFSGGPSSVRAFRTRSLGPGSYQPTAADQNSFFDRSGDIRLEANIEYRFPIYSFLKGALFVDAGNVWLNNENAALPGGKFSSDFIKELGIGYGAGLRVDIQSFVIRFDLASPFSKPYLPVGKRTGFNLSEILFNFGIGYPF
ncbi:translocation and assembly module lipoprotein TamL [Roseivirga echinicomitans]